MGDDLGEKIISDLAKLIEILSLGVVSPDGSLTSS